MFSFCFLFKNMLYLYKKIMNMLTVEKMKESSELHSLRKDLARQKSPVMFYYRLGNALTNFPMGDKDIHFDTDIYLEKYKMNLQRPYVWTYPQQNAFIQSILYEKIISPVVIISHSVTNEQFGEHIYYVIDGKQRLTTVHKFLNNEFPVEIGFEKYYYKDFDDKLKTYFNRNLDMMEAIFYYSYPDNPITDDEKIQIFNFYNFTGTPQAEEHKIKLQSLLKQK